MAATIYKYPLAIEDEQKIRMPAYPILLSVQVQHRQLCVWAIVDPDHEPTNVTFWLRGTGHPLGDARGYLGTVQMADGALVWHVFTNAMVVGQ